MEEVISVLECEICGRLLVGIEFNATEIELIAGQRGHITADLEVAQRYKGHTVMCYGKLWQVYRPAVLTAFRLGGKAAAEAMVDQALRKSIEDYERQNRGPHR